MAATVAVRISGSLSANGTAVRSNQGKHPCRIAFVLIDQTLAVANHVGHRLKAGDDRIEV